MSESAKWAPEFWRTRFLVDSLPGKSFVPYEKPLGPNFGFPELQMARGRDALVDFIFQLRRSAGDFFRLPAFAT